LYFQPTDFHPERRAPHGIPIGPGFVLVHPTLTGDASLDGRVDFFDIVRAG
jgi:hypothetical protein